MFSRFIHVSEFPFYVNCVGRAETLNSELSVASFLPSRGSCGGRVQPSTPGGAGTPPSTPPQPPDVPGAFGNLSSLSFLLVLGDHEPHSPSWCGANTCAVPGPCHPPPAQSALGGSGFAERQNQRIDPNLGRSVSIHHSMEGMSTPYPVT